MHVRESKVWTCWPLCRGHQWRRGPTWKSFLCLFKSVNWCGYLWVRIYFSHAWQCNR